MDRILTLEEVGQSGIYWNRKPVYAVLLDGKKVGELYFNMTGYTGCYLPQPSGIPLHVGEGPISAYRKVIARLNRESALAHQES